MKLIVGLGNPGSKYEGTRHNIGFAVAEKLAVEVGISLKKKVYQGLYGAGRVAGQDVGILLPQTFMNLSGTSVKAALKALGLSSADLIVIHDEIDLPFGAVRLKVGGGHGGHNGLRNIKALLSDGDFLRLRVGVGRPTDGRDVAAHVLGRFGSEENRDMEDVIEGGVGAVQVLLEEGVAQAMNQFNSRSFIRNS